MANNVLGALTLRMVADLGQLQKDMGKATKMVEKFGSDVKKIVGAIGVGLSFTYLKNLAQTALDAGDNLAKMSVKTGLSIQMLQDLELAAKMSDIHLEKLTMTMSKLQISVSKSLAGNDKASGALKKMGIDPTQLKDADELLTTILKKISEAGDTGALANAASLVGGKNAANLVIMADQYTRARDIMKSFGLSLSGLDVSKLEEANDIMKALGHYTELVTRQIMVGMAPAIIGIANWMLKLKEGGEDAKDKWQKVGKTIGDVMITAVQWTIKAIAEIEILINKLVSLGKRVYMQEYTWPGGSISIPQIAPEDPYEKRRREEWERQIRAKAKADAEGVKVATVGLLPKGKSRKIGAAAPDAEKVQKEADRWNQQLVKFKQEQDKVNAGSDEWRIKISDINAEYNKLLIEFPKHTVEIEKQRKLRLEHLEFEREIAYINIQYKEELAKENAELERSSILNKAKIDTEKQLADAQLSLRSSRGEDVDLIRMDLDYKKQVADLDRQIADLEGKMKGAAELTQLAYKAQVDALKMQYPILEEILKINKQIKEESDLRKKDPYAGAIDGLKEISDKYSEYGTMMKSFTIDTVKTMEDAWVDFCVNGKFSFESFVTSVLSGLLRMMTQMLIIAPIAKSLSQAISGIAGAGGGFGGFMFELLGGGGGMFFKQGAAFSHGRVTPFARGDIFNSPTLFPMAGGMGLMGEAGPEAVMPLTRGKDGKLGVKASGLGEPNIQIVVNNESGIPMTMESQGMQFDGEKYIVGVVMRNINKFGPLFQLQNGGRR